jgi:hypothetical protein
MDVLTVSAVIVLSLIVGIVFWRAVTGTPARHLRRDLESWVAQAACGFDPRPRHQVSRTSAQARRMP